MPSGSLMWGPTLAALLIDVNQSPEGGYDIQLKWRPEPPGADSGSTSHAADARGAVREAEKALQAHYRYGVPIEFHADAFATIAEAIAAIRAQICP